MEWHGIMDSGRDPRLEKMMLELIPVFGPDHVEVVDTPGPSRLMGNGDAAGGEAKQLLIAIGNVPALFIPFLEMLELQSQDAGLNRDHGQPQKYYHEFEGYNGRLDAIQAGILRLKLEHLEEWNKQRRDIADRYQELFRLAAGSITVPHEPAWARAVYHLYVIRTENRDQLKHHLFEAGIATGIHYPMPLHLQKACRNLGYKEGDFPVTEKLALEILSLPVYPQLQLDQQRHIAKAVMEFVAVQATAR